MGEIIKAETGALSTEMADTMSAIVLQGDLSKLTQAQKAQYYHGLCQSLGLNPLTKPFDLLRLNGKEVMYANRACAEQLRLVHGVSITNIHTVTEGDIVIVTATGQNRNGRADTEIGCVSIKGLTGDARANAYMKCLTKAKRRLTLSLCGLGMMDELEAETIPGAVTASIDIDVQEQPQRELVTKPLREAKQETEAQPFDIGYIGDGAIDVNFEPVDAFTETPEASEELKLAIAICEKAKEKCGDRQVAERKLKSTLVSKFFQKKTDVESAPTLAGYMAEHLTIEQLNQIKGLLG